MLQKVHTIYNYLYVLEKTSNVNGPNKEELRNKLRELENTYTSAHDDVKAKEEAKLKQKMTELGTGFEPRVWRKVLFSLFQCVYTILIPFFSLK